MTTMRATGPDKAAFKRLVEEAGDRHGLHLVAPVDLGDWDEAAEGHLSCSCQISPPTGWSAGLHRGRLRSEARAGSIRVNLGFDAAGQPTAEMAAAVDRMATQVKQVRRRERAIEATGGDVLTPPAWSVTADALIVSIMRMADIDVDGLMAKMNNPQHLRRVMSAKSRDGDMKVRLDLHIQRGELAGTASLHQRLSGRGFQEVIRLKTGPKMILGIGGYAAPATVISSLSGQTLGAVLATPAIAGSGDRLVMQAGQDADSLLTLALAPRLTWLADAPPGVGRDWRS